MSPTGSQVVPIASPITAVPVASPPDVQAAVASQFIAPAPPATTGAVPVAGVPVPVFTDPVAVARAYTTARWTFHAAERAGYTLALTAPGLSTPAFAARSAPTALALAQGVTSHDVSSVTVTAAGISAEAPHTGVLAFVSVAYTRTDLYTGVSTPQAAQHVWSLRVTRASATSGWLVDGVQLDG